MTIVVDGKTTSVEQVRKQLEKVVDVVRVTEISSDDMISRELALVKVKTTPSTRSEVMQIVDIFRANIVDVGLEALTVEVTGDEEKINSLLVLLSGFGIKELARTGRIAMTRRGGSPVKTARTRAGK
jgi:acetolactate synthase-1/3 small subunit